MSAEFLEETLKPHFWAYFYVYCFKAYLSLNGIICSSILWTWSEFSCKHWVLNRSNNGWTFASRWQDASPRLACRLYNLFIFWLCPKTPNQGKQQLTMHKPIIFLPEKIPAIGSLLSQYQSVGSLHYAFIKFYIDHHL